MNSVALKFADEDGVIQVSPTLATLEARGLVKNIRSYLTCLDGSSGDEHMIAAIRTELDDVADFVSDILSGLDGYIPEETHKEEVKELADKIEEMEKEGVELEAKVEKLEGEIDTYRQAAEGSVDEVRDQLTVALDRITKHDAEMAKMQDKVTSAIEARNAMAQARIATEKEATADRAEVRRMKNRMDAWSKENPTAAETADTYRERYERESQRTEKMERAARRVLDEQTSAAKTSARRDAVRSVRDALLMAIREARL